MPMLIKNFRQAVSKAEALCAKAERTPKEIADKFRAWGFSRVDTEHAIQLLEENKFIDVERYTRAFVHDKLMCEHWGRRKIANSLFLKEIPEHVIREALNDQVDPDVYFEILLEYTRKIIEPMEIPLSEYDSMRLRRAVCTRGFEPELYERALEQVLSEKG